MHAEPRYFLLFLSVLRGGISWSKHEPKAVNKDLLPCWQSLPVASGIVTETQWRQERKSCSRKHHSDWWGLTTAYVCLNCQLIEVGNDFSRRQTLLLILINSLCIVVYRNMSAFSINLPASLFSNIFQLATWPFTADRCCHSWYSSHMTSGRSTTSSCWCWPSSFAAKMKQYRNFKEEYYTGVVVFVCL